MGAYMYQWRNTALGKRTMSNKNKNEKDRISITLLEPYLKGIEECLESGIYATRGDVIRDGLKLLFEKRKIEPF
ncbi:unnamed protein product [marine sediment metagenome]|uniref:Ribbon-helix-helix protein CopG domain-containing protein n=1 Tax=marine sediment metagenome TaxID=412755 RepID=X1BPW5_9ZZZZ